MREILFRGKRVDNGKWVEGSFCMDATEQLNGVKKSADGFIRRFNPETCRMDMFEVDRETVGQFTRLTDRNSTKIFEGDIVNYNGEPGYVGFDKENAEFLIFFSKWTAGFDSIYCDRNAEVIGNIYDNPNLLEVSEND